MLTIHFLVNSAKLNYFRPTDNFVWMESNRETGRLPPKQGVSLPKREA